MENIILIGFMGSGKTTVGKLLAKHLDMAFIDMDEAIESAQGKTVREIFDEQGESAFRTMETKYLEQSLEAKNMILATGGGVVMRPENVRLLDEIGTIIFLHASLEQLIAQLRNDTKRPLIQGENYEVKVKTLLEQREATYLSVADVIIQTTGKVITEVVDEVLDIL